MMKSKRWSGSRRFPWVRGLAFDQVHPSPSPFAAHASVNRPPSASASHRISGCAASAFASRPAMVALQPILRDVAWSTPESSCTYRHARRARGRVRMQRRAGVPIPCKGWVGLAHASQHLRESPRIYNPRLKMRARHEHAPTVRADDLHGRQKRAPREEGGREPRIDHAHDRQRRG